jgi:hypothetical protein
MRHRQGRLRDLSDRKRSPMKTPAESDWKKFRAMVPKLRERYLAERTGRIAALLTNSKKSETERFWDALEEMEKEAKVLRYCLDGHSRSKMWLFMLSMIHAGMMKKEDLAEFSEELQQSISYVFDGK